MPLVSEQHWAETIEWIKNLARWNTVLHMTFKWEVSDDSARRQFKRWLGANGLDGWAIKRGGMVVGRQVGFPCIACNEENPSRDGHHIHAMMYLSPNVRRVDLWADWFDHKGRNRIEPIDFSRSGGGGYAAVAGYCTKYLFKNQTFWGIYGLGLPEQILPGLCDRNPAWLGQM